MAKNLGDLFIQGGWVMWPLLVFSILTWAVVIERTIVYLGLRPRLQKLTLSVMNSLKSGDASQAKQLCNSEKAPLSEVFLGTLDTRRGKEPAERLTERNRVRMVGYLKKNLWILGTIGSVSPFIGLLGTVVGIVRAFHSMSQTGTGGFNAVSAGISEALIATAAGLIVAIVALLAYNIFVTAANQTMGSLKLTLEELLEESFQPGQRAQNT